MNHAETQYDEAAAYSDALRADNTKEIEAESVATLTGETPTAGRLVFDTETGYLYGGNGTAWVLMGSTRQYLFRLGTEEVAWTDYSITGAPTFTEWPLLNKINITSLIAEGMSVTDSAIDLTPYSKLYIAWEGSFTGLNSNNVSLVASATKNAGYNTYDARIIRTSSFTANTAVLESLDISALNGSYYIRYHAYSDDDDASDLVNLQVYAIWLEV